VPVELLECKLSQVVQPGLLQQRQPDPAGEPPGQRLDVVVEIDEQRLAETALDEAVGVTVVGPGQRLPGEETADVTDQDLALEMGD